MQEKILILDFGSQYTQLIARRVRELNVYCEIHPFNRIPALDASVRGVILSGSPYSVRDKEAPRVDLSAIKGKLPLLGVCYGAQYLSHCYGGEVAPSATREYGRAMLSKTEGDNPLIRDLSERTQVWMSHGDTIVRIPESYRIIASTEDVPVAAFQIDGEQTWGIQFHPEVYHSTEGKQLLKHFVVDICGCRQDWTPASFVESTVAELREKIGPDKVLLGLSGGVDSSVAAMLLHRAVGRQLICIFVDMGLLRKDEFENVLKSYESMGLNVIGVRAGEKFLSDLKGVTDPERKRKIIGRDFIEVFDAEAQKLTDVRWLAQGTIYPDVIESTSVNGPSATIKLHHYVGGLPVKMNRHSEPPSVPGPWARHPHSGRSDGRKGTHPAGSRQDIHRRTKRIRPVRPGMAGRRDAAAGPVRRRDGRRADLRELRRAARRHFDGRHDGRLGPSALRFPRENVQRHHQPRERNQPRRLRYQLETARNDRVGVKLLRSTIRSSRISPVR